MIENDQILLKDPPKKFTMFLWDVRVERLGMQSASYTPHVPAEAWVHLMENAL